MVRSAQGVSGYLLDHTIKVMRYTIDGEHHTIYELSINGEFSCFQFRGFDIYCEAQERWYLWDSRTLAEKHFFKDLDACMRYIVSHKLLLLTGR